MKVLNAKLREKFIEALKAVLPIVAIVLDFGIYNRPGYTECTSLLSGRNCNGNGWNDVFYIRCGDVNDADGRKSRCMYDKK